MPSILKVLNWFQCNAEEHQNVIIQISKPPLFGLKRQDMSLLAIDNFIQLSGKKFLFEILLSGEIKTDVIKYSLHDDCIQLIVRKAESKCWQALSKNQNMTKEEFKAIKSALLEKLRNQNTARREEIFKNLDECKQKSQIDFESEIYEMQNSIKGKKDEILRNSGDSFTAKELYVAKDVENEEDIPIREKKIIEYRQSERIFDTPLRESNFEKEKEILKKREEYLRMSLVDKKDVEAKENDPKWLIGKAEEYLEVNCQQSCLSILHHARQLSRTKKDKGLELHLCAIEAELAQKNGKYHRALELIASIERFVDKNRGFGDLIGTKAAHLSEIVERIQKVKLETVRNFMEHGK
ncbi:MAG: Dynein assembly factor 4, axonemal [Marteilia pararefringens]